MQRSQYGAREIGSEPVRILIADDDARVRHGLRALIESQRGWTVVGEAVDGPDVLQLDRTLEADVIVLDIRLPDAHDGLELLRHLAGEKRRSVLAISVRGGLGEAALAAGARAFVEKGDTDALLSALHRVIVGRNDPVSR